MTRVKYSLNTEPPFRFDRACPLDALRRRLVELADSKYRDFVAKFLPGVDGVLGVRVPTLRSLAQEIAQTCGVEFLNAVLGVPSLDSDVPRRVPTNVVDSSFKSQEKSESGVTGNRCDFSSYEERLAVGLVLAETRLDFDSRLDALAAFVPFLESWGDCDVFSASLRVPNDRRDEFWEFLDFCAESSRPFEVRFAVVATLNHFLEKSWLDVVFERANRIAARRLGEYYVDMSLAWLVAEAFIRFPDATLNFLARNDFDDFTFNKSLQKIVESRRVDEETKDEIRRLKRPRRARRSDG